LAATTNLPAYSPFFQEIPHPMRGELLEIGQRTQIRSQRLKLRETKGILSPHCEFGSSTLAFNVQTSKLAVLELFFTDSGV
jgi:hypothetical protein